LKETSVFTYQHIVSKQEIDHLGHVNNVIYLQWVQDASTKHWNLLSKNIETDEVVWVVIRHEIDYKRQAVIGDKIIVKTWIGETSGVTSIRHVEIYKANTLLAKAKTTWCLVNAKTLRPTRITDSILSLLNSNK
jgi:acyl-CoA thioester hydrolase